MAPHEGERQFETFDLDSEPDQRRSSERQVVDLTAESDSDDVVPIFPKSQSVIGSDTDDEAGDDDQYDEDLKRAIALSLQDAQGGSQNASSYPQISDSEKGEPQGTDSPSVEEVEEKTNGQEPAKSMGIFGLDRKQMEQERLARLAKRKAEDTSSIDLRETKHSKIDLAPKPTPTSSRSIPSTSPSVQYPEGIVKKTWAFGCPRQGDDIKIEEVLQKSDLELAVLSSFMWEMDWLFSKFNVESTRFIMVMQAEDEATKRQYESETATMRNLRLCFPPMGGQVVCMHSKLMLLFHPGYLRLVVPTANLTPFDWGEMNGVMENSVFLIDLPKKNGAEKPTTHFYEDLVHFLKASTLHENVIAKLDSFDFSKTSKYAFVHTIGGSHTDTAWRRTGYCGLGRAVERMNLRTSVPLNIDFIASSVGAITDQFLRSLYLASQGDDGLTEFTIRYSKSCPVPRRDDPSKLLKKDTGTEWKDRFRLYFPSQNTIATSKGGPRCAGTICFQSRWYNGENFPRHILRDCESQRKGLLMHNKILYVRPDEPIPLSESTQCRAWAYIGSANLSESAWGRLVQDRSTKSPKLNCRNWECGVIVPVIEDKTDTPEVKNKMISEDKGKGKGKASESSSSSSSSTNNDDDDGRNLPAIFGDTVPVPMRVPGARYSGGRKPWFFAESQS
ncbi:tyrosyl-DNA phosphodiesterase [Aspergillus piperis CBS 112811]|uniref:Tyrosyl-DNA phosphodiesterase n=1 Tax=Aspergillus piperis CBS 112811 TaxID=1448313 RepID=A0A8G1VV14_9EURO|nr:tyrosyl-DNA phosphodiesterase [Aspergillus piperis CBS 112811]RAH63398.1 tyrosyl-DNA phosphodiesterase [Aspergillus piperis CBS 112811]